MKMSLDSSGVKAGLTKAGASIKNFAQAGMERLNALAKVAAVGLAAAFVGLSKKAISLGSTLSDIAESTGFATEQFQVFRGAFIRAGGSAEKMEKAISSMQKAIVQGSEGLTTYTRAFERIGLSVDQLRQMRPEEQFQTIALAIANAKDQQGAFTAAQEIFGTRVAPRMMEVFRRLAKDGYGKMAEEIEQTYGIMDAQTQKTLDSAADAIEAFKNKITIKVGEIISGKGSHAAIKALGVQLLIQVSNFKESMLNAIVFAATSIPRYMGAAIELARDKMGGGSATFAEKLSEINDIVLDPFDESEKRAVLQDTLETYQRILKTSGQINDSRRDGLGIQKELTELEQFQEILAKAKVRGNEDMIAKATEAIAVEKEIQRIIKSQNIGREEAKAIIQKQREELEWQQDMALGIAEAEAMGDEQTARALADEISRRNEINALVKATGVSEDEAARLIDGKNAKLQEEKNLRKDLLDATLSQNNKAITAAEIEIELKERARAIADETGMAFDDAIEKAKQLLQMDFGPDLNMSGFVTPFEQREFDRRQKEINKMNRADERAEIRDERERGGNLRNVSQRRRDESGAVGVRRRALAAEEERIRRRENAEIQRRRNRGENMDDIMADVNERRNQRMGDINDEINKERLKGLRGDARDKEIARQQEERKQRDQKPKEPVKPEDKMIDKLGGKIDTTNQKLEDIKKLLTC